MELDTQTPLKRTMELCSFEAHMCCHGLRPLQCGAPVSDSTGQASQGVQTMAVLLVSFALFLNLDMVHMKWKYDEISWSPFANHVSRRVESNAYMIWVKGLVGCIISDHWSAQIIIAVSKETTGGHKKLIQRHQELSSRKKSICMGEFQIRKRFLPHGECHAMTFFVRFRIFGGTTPRRMFRLLGSKAGRRAFFVMPIFLEKPEESEVYWLIMVFLGLSWFIMVKWKNHGWSEHFRFIWSVSCGFQGLQSLPFLTV